MSLNDSIKKITRGYLESLKLTDVQYGTITKTNPLEVNVDQRLLLPEDFLIVPEHMTEFVLTIGEQSYTIRKGLEAGDKVILIREHGGLNFTIAGRMTT